MDNLLDRCSLRLLLIMQSVEKAYAIYTWFVSELALAIASDVVLDRYNDLAYGTNTAYRPDLADFRRYLFPWEEKVIERLFPPPPARILVGGAGGGREVFALAHSGYQIVAFEASPILACSLSAAVPAGMPVKVFQARYEDLPSLYSATAGIPAGTIDALGPFDAAIVGWGSFAHLRTEDQRVQTLKDFARVTRGPLLLSFFLHNLDPGAPERPGRLRSLLRGRFNRDPGNAFSLGLGFYHYVSVAEITALIHKAGLKVIYLNVDARDTNWPHAVLI
jgi:hypothetical protein